MLVGCYKYFPAKLMRMNGIHCPKNKSNNCLLLCIGYALKTSFIIGESTTKKQKQIMDVLSKCKLNKNTLLEEDFFFMEFVEVISAVLMLSDNRPTLEVLSDVMNVSFEVLTTTTSIPKIFEPFVTKCIERKKTIYVSSKKERPLKIGLLFYEDHCVYIENKRLNSLCGYCLCKTCKHWISTRNFTQSLDKHFKHCVVCDGCGRAVMDNGKHKSRCTKFHIKESKNPVVDKKMNDDPTHIDCRPLRTLDRRTSTKTYLNNQMFCDIETFHDKETKEHVCYAAAYITSSMEKPVLFLGKNSMDELVKVMLNFDGTVWFYNGSGFDMFFVLKCMLSKELDLRYTQITKANNKIYSLRYKSGFKARKITVFKDLYLFCMGSLASACASFGVEDNLKKKEFDHSLIKDFWDVEKYKEKINLYLSYDVISLRALHEKLAGAVFDSHSVNIEDFMTKASLSYGIFNSSLPKNLIYCPPININERMRRAYYGGRTTPQCGLYESPCLSNCIEIENSESSLMIPPVEGLHYIDVSSLYPSVMAGMKYPSGKMRYRLDFDYLLEMINKDFEVPFDKCFLTVDVECPDIATPFLFSKDKNGKLEKDLLPKINQSYMGVELVHAVKLGYKITKIYECIEWESMDEIFTDFITKEYKAKSMSERGTAKYMVHKFLMNSLSGKFGQHEHFEKITYVPFSDFDKFTKKKDITSWLPFYKNDGSINYIEVTTSREKTHSDYPVYLSAYILALSRIKMSYELLKMNGYKKDNSFYYTDTDSYHVHTKQFRGLTLKEELGCFGDELDGGVIVAALFLAPKTYHHVYSKNNKLWSVMKCKGIPHSSKPFPAFKRFYASSDEELLVRQFISDKFDMNIQYISFGKPLYIYKSSDNDDFVVLEKLDYMVVKDKLLNPKEVEIIVLYGTMKRTFNPEGFLNQKFLSISSVFASRQLCATDWWSKNNRILIGITREEQLRNKTYPIGHSIGEKINKVNAYLEELSIFPDEVLVTIQEKLDEMSYYEKKFDYFKYMINNFNELTNFFDPKMSIIPTDHHSLERSFRTKTLVDVAITRIPNFRFATEINHKHVVVFVFEVIGDGEPMLLAFNGYSLSKKH